MSDFFFYTDFLTAWANSNTKLQQFQPLQTLFGVKPLVYDLAYAEIPLSLMRDDF